MQLLPTTLPAAGESRCCAGHSRHPLSPARSWWSTDPRLGDSRPVLPLPGSTTRASMCALHGGVCWLYTQGLQGYNRSGWEDVLPQRIARQLWELQHLHAGRIRGLSGKVLPLVKAAGSSCSHSHVYTAVCKLLRYLAQTSHIFRCSSPLSARE